jgi:hypothetical protein
VPVSKGVSRRRRLARLLATGSPRVVVRAARRALVSRRHEASIARAAREGRHLLVGPFLGEVGFELLYWIPFVRRLLDEHQVGRDRVTVLARGGAGSWYGDLAERSVEILDLLPPDRYVEELVERRRRSGDAKQFFPDLLDSRLAELAIEQSGDAAVVHPLLMFSRMRLILEGLQPAEQAPLLADYQRLAWDDRSLPPDCPSDYVAVKLYFSDVFPDDGRTRTLAARVLEMLAEEAEVVVLTSGLQLDEHREWVPVGRRIHDSSAWVTPQNNLTVQTALVARARAFVCTYGGFSYLGAMLGIPTLALQTREPFSSVHLAVLRAAYPEADYTLVEPDGIVEAARFASRVAGSFR